MEVKILHEEKHFLCAIKPSGLLSESADGKNESFADVLKEHCECEIYPVHRLDREASGVMVYAKTKAGAAKLSSLFSENKVEKKYLVVFHGTLESASGVLEDLLFKDSGKNKSYVVKRERKGVKKAKLEYKVLQTVKLDGKTYSLAEIKLHTGRTHQIRVQLSSRGCSVVGDSRYGSKENCSMALFSASLSFENPFTHEKMLFEEKPESEMYKNFELL